MHEEANESHVLSTELEMNFENCALSDWPSIKLKGLILAQNERWRRGLGMQVEREPKGRQLFDGDSGERVSNAWSTCLSVGDNLGKPRLIPDSFNGSHELLNKAGLSLKLAQKEGTTSY